jgi:hypothetical protein
LRFIHYSRAGGLWGFGAFGACGWGINAVGDERKCSRHGLGVPKFKKVVWVDPFFVLELATQLGLPLFLPWDVAISLDELWRSFFSVCGSWHNGRGFFG